MPYFYLSRRGLRGEGSAFPARVHDSRGGQPRPRGGHVVGPQLLAAGYPLAERQHLVVGQLHDFPRCGGRDLPALYRVGQHLIRKQPQAIPDVLGRDAQPGGDLGRRLSAQIEQLLEGACLVQGAQILALQVLLQLLQPQPIGGFPHHHRQHGEARALGRQAAAPPGDDPVALPPILEGPVLRDEQRLQHAEFADRRRQLLQPPGALGVLPVLAGLLRMREYLIEGHLLRADQPALGRLRAAAHVAGLGHLQDRGAGERATTRGHAAPPAHTRHRAPPPCDRRARGRRPEPARWARRG